jgi:hypothetical protein
MIAEAASAGLHEEPGFAPVPRLQIVTIEQAMQLRERAVHLPARREDTFKRAAREEDTTRQRALDLWVGVHPDSLVAHHIGRASARLSPKPPTSIASLPPRGGGLG